MSSSPLHRVLHAAQLAHRAADLAGDVGEAVRSEDQQRHEQDDEDFRRADAHVPIRDRTESVIGDYRLRSRRAISALVRRGVRAELDQRRPEVPAEAIERGTGRRELPADPYDEHREQRRAEHRDEQCKHPRHGRCSATARDPGADLPVERATHLRRELLEPVLAGEEQVEVEEVVGRERRADPRLRAARPGAATPACGRRSTRAGRRCAGWPPSRPRPSSRGSGSSTNRVRRPRRREQ